MVGVGRFEGLRGWGSAFQLLGIMLENRRNADIECIWKTTKSRLLYFQRLISCAAFPGWRSDSLLPISLQSCQLPPLNRHGTSIDGSALLGGPCCSFEGGGGLTLASEFNATARLIAHKW